MFIEFLSVLRRYIACDSAQFLFRSGGREKRKTPPVKNVKAKRVAHSLGPNSIWKPDRAHTSTHERKEKEQFPEWTHSPTPDLFISIFKLAFVAPGALRGFQAFDGLTGSNTEKNKTTAKIKKQLKNSFQKTPCPPRKH